MHTGSRPSSEPVYTVDRGRSSRTSSLPWSFRISPWAEVSAGSRAFVRTSQVALSWQAFHVANPPWYLSGDELWQRAEGDRRDVDPPIQVETTMWSKAGRLDGG